MKKLLTLILWFAAWLSCAALAQTWALYAPPERDFRVVFPGVPSRLVTPAGSVEYRFGDSQYTYSVFRHDPRRASSINAARSDIIQRISGDDQRVQDLGEEQNYTNPNDFIFRVGPIRSMHRVFVSPGRYYEIVVQAGPEDGIPELAAQQFFQTFQLGNTGVFPAFANLPSPDSCGARASGIAQRFCEYLTCLNPGYQGHPVCGSLPPLLRF